MSSTNFRVVVDRPMGTLTATPPDTKQTRIWQDGAKLLEETILEALNHIDLPPPLKLSPVRATTWSVRPHVIPIKIRNFDPVNHRLTLTIRPESADNAHVFEFVCSPMQQRTYERLQEFLRENAQKHGGADPSEAGEAETPRGSAPSGLPPGEPLTPESMARYLREIGPRRERFEQLRRERDAAQQKVKDAEEALAIAQLELETKEAALARMKETIAPQMDEVARLAAALAELQATFYGD